MEKIEEELGDDNAEYLAASKAYYYAKAEVDVLTEIVKEIRGAARAAQKKVDKAKLGGSISDYDKRTIDE